ncbi:uncharacterized protein BO97DRAFT_419132 [Aspergillus homomorphus CBS 101889]|uniref:Uncharacterized protein n=1 Tax=Aspergillus homomorphus (strain CBS 101889) TaxID=1450537 RepID=A0A395HFQ2_ASPHC|nr:hypothetical protein BO97DRAFT_419132 [Aspergillus homomorphus CBS 101889]RAL06781.1 hypothetical protein BO97DRAFT_419132 [Aspergillus homomorphus CBS 101889]
MSRTTFQSNAFRPWKPSNIKIFSPARPLHSSPHSTSDISTTNPFSQASQLYPSLDSPSNSTLDSHRDHPRGRPLAEAYMPSNARASIKSSSRGLLHHKATSLLSKLLDHNPQDTATTPHMQTQSDSAIPVLISSLDSRDTTEDSTDIRTSTYNSVEILSSPGNSEDPRELWPIGKEPDIIPIDPPILNDGCSRNASLPGYVPHEDNLGPVHEHQHLETVGNKIDVDVVWIEDEPHNAVVTDSSRSQSRKRLPHEQSEVE